MYKYYSIKGEIDKRMMIMGYSNGDLAEKVGVTYHHLSKVRSGKVSASTKLVNKISKVLGVEIEDIFKITEKEVK